MDPRQLPADQLLPAHRRCRSTNARCRNRSGALPIDPALLHGTETVTVVLSHFHLDHVTGLGFLSKRAVEDRQVTIAGPGAVFYNWPTRSIVDPNAP